MDDTTNEAAVEQPVDSPAVETSDKPTTDDAVSSADAPTDSSGPADSATTASDADAPTADVAPALTNFADVVVAAMATQAAATVAEPAAEVVVVDRESVKHLGFIQQQERDFEAKLQNQASAVREQLIDTTKLPPSYSQNSHREKACLSFVANFRRQYTLLYPGRKELILVPKNEVGVQKFICTTLRPTQLNYEQLYEYRECARFVADHLAYTPLPVPFDLPTVVPSPSYTLKMQSGNSLDFSIVLASLLLGVGYDAFVCSGYADRKVTEMDELTTDLPLEKISLEDTSSLGAAQPSDPLTERKYNIKTLRQLKSNFLTKQFEKEKAKVDQAQGLLKNATPVQELQEQATPQDVDEYEGLRLHFWVLVLPGQREIADPFFIEATTGKIYPVDHASYLGVESVFNSYNYWVNMQTCFDGLKGISFDLGDNSKWEFIFLDNAQTGRLQKKNNKSDDKTGSRSLDDDEIDGKTKEVLDVPPSWVERLDIDKAKFELRAPSGVKTIHYKNASLEEFAPYVRNDGLVSRVTVLENVKDNTPMEIRESFENRKDKLVRRYRVPAQKLVVESFEQGRSFGVREVIMSAGEIKEMRFYSEARIDNLLKRVEQSNKTLEFFVDRDDYLEYRAVKYDSNDRNQNEAIKESSVLKFTEKFGRNLELPMGTDVKKRTFHLRDEKIATTYHLEQGRIFNAFEEFHKPPSDRKINIAEYYDYYDPNPLSKAREPHEIFARYELALKAEANCIQAVKVADREVREYLLTRMSEEKEPQLVVSIYDTIRNEALLTANKEAVNGKLKEEELKAAEADYLSPFLVNVVNPQNLAKEEAMRVRDECMKALKERLIERATIIQVRNDQETQAYQRRQADYQRHQESMTSEEHEEYRNFCNEALFRIHILERRLNKHKESAPEKYIALDRKLRSDPRIARYL